jgi:hypothetical protein
MRHLSSALLFLSLLLPAFGQVNSGNTLHGRVNDEIYTAPGGIYRVHIPVLPELGGTVTDTQNVVVFQDNFNVHVSIGSFPQDATQRWELSTRGLKDYLPFFFGNVVMPNFAQSFPGTRIESATFDPKLLGGALYVYTLLPNGSMFSKELGGFRDDTKPLVAKRGNLVFIQHNIVYVVSVELAERVLEGASYKKTTAQEDAILHDRLDQIASTMTFAAPAETK